MDLRQINKFDGLSHVSNKYRFAIGYIDIRDHFQTTSEWWLPYRLKKLLDL